MSFLQHFTVFKKNSAIQIFSYLHGVKDWHFLISKPVAIMVEHFIGPIKASPMDCSIQGLISLFKNDHDKRCAEF